MPIFAIFRWPSPRYRKAGRRSPLPPLPRRARRRRAERDGGAHSQSKIAVVIELQRGFTLSQNPAGPARPVCHRRRGDYIVAPAATAALRTETAAAAVRAGAAAETGIA